MHTYKKKKSTHVVYLTYGCNTYKQTKARRWKEKLRCVLHKPQKNEYVVTIHFHFCTYDYASFSFLYFHSGAVAYLKSHYNMLRTRVQLLL